MDAATAGGAERKTDIPPTSVQLTVPDSAKVRRRAGHAFTVSLERILSAEHLVATGAGPSEALLMDVPDVVFQCGPIGECFAARTVLQLRANNLVPARICRSIVFRLSYGAIACAGQVRCGLSFRYRLRFSHRGPGRRH